MKLCRFISELINIPIENISDFRKGVYLSNIMHKINPHYFPLDSSFDDWDEAKSILDRFLISKGIRDNSIEIETSEILDGNSELLVAAIFQILVILAIFNSQFWEKFRKSIDLNNFVLIDKILVPMIEETTYKFNLNHKSQFKNEQNDLKMMLRKLELFQAKIESHETQVKELNLEILFEKKENVNKIRQINDLKSEIAKITQLKDDLIFQLEYKIPKEISVREQANAAKISNLHTEISDLSKMNAELNKLIESLHQELAKKDLDIIFFVERQSQFDELSRQCNYYKSLSESLRIEKEMTEIRLLEFEGIEKKRNETLAELNAERNNSNTQKLANTCLQNKVDSLFKRLAFAEEKLKTGKKQSLSHLERYNEMAKQIASLKETEEKNLKMKNLLCEFLAATNFDQVRRIQQLLKESALIDLKTITEIAEKMLESNVFDQSKQMLTSFENNPENIDVRKQNRKTNVDSMKLEIESFNDDSAIGRSIGAGRFNSYEINEFDAERIESLVINSSDLNKNSDILQLLYSVFMNYRMLEIAQENGDLFSRGQRKRDILKPFRLSEVINRKNM